MGPQVHSTRNIRVSVCTPQGPSLYSMSNRRLNPTLVPQSKFSAGVPNRPEGLILCTGPVSRTLFCSLISATSRKKYITVEKVEGHPPAWSMFRPEGKCQGFPLKSVLFPLDEALLRNAIVNRKRNISLCEIDKRGRNICGTRQQMTPQFQCIYVDCICWQCELSPWLKMISEVFQLWSNHSHFIFG